MFSFKRSLIALVGLLVIVGVLATLMPLVSRGQGQAPFGPRKFYLTQTTHTGSQALTACADGYHMASLWEIFDPSNLKYNTQLGLTKDDSGFGPPAGETATGWVRSGDDSRSLLNCRNWTTDSEPFGVIIGTNVFLKEQWAPPAVVISPWEGSTVNCSQEKSVWCVQD